MASRYAQQHLVNEVSLDEMSLDDALNVVGSASLTGGASTDCDTWSLLTHAVAYAPA
jgi:hypothetical protein